MVGKNNIVKLGSLIFGFILNILSCATAEDKIYGAYEIQLLEVRKDGEWVNAKDCLKSNKIAFNREGISFLPGFERTMGSYKYEFIDGSITFNGYNECFFRDDDIFTVSFSDDTIILSSLDVVLHSVRRGFDNTGKIEFDMFDLQGRSDLWGTSECASARLSACK